MTGSSIGGRIMRARVLAGVLLGLIWSGVALAGPKWDFGEGSWLQLALLAQIQGTYDDATEPEADVFLRRGRIVLSGQLTDGVLFFAETDNTNAGRYGQAEAATRWQDLYVDLRLGKTNHWVKAGLVLLPFSFETRSSAGSLLGLDYNVEAIKLGNNFAWRDYGVEMHGHAGKRFAYAVGIFDGYDSKEGTKNPDAGPRIAGHVAFNPVGDVETGWFFSQDRLGKKGTYLSLGLGGEVQNRATRKPGAPGPLPGDPPGPDTIEDSQAWVADLQSGYRLTERLGLTVNAAWYDWDNAVFDGTTAFVESGLLYRSVAGTVKYAVQDPHAAGATSDVTVGFGYFHRGHNLRMGIEYRWGDSSDLWLAGVQILL